VPYATALVRLIITSQQGILNKQFTKSASVPEVGVGAVRYANTLALEQLQLRVL